jgi:ubiquinone biosynthesis monooxygenase Coq6
MGCVVENRLLQAALLRAAERATCQDHHSSNSSSTGNAAREAGCLDFLCPGSLKAATFPGLSGVDCSVLSTTEAASTASRSARGGAEPADWALGSNLVTLEMTDGTSLRCRLVVAADGAQSKIRQLAGFRTMGWSYDQRGVVATVATDVPNDTAWQRFMPTGELCCQDLTCSLGQHAMLNGMYSYRVQ